MKNKKNFSCSQNNCLWHLIMLYVCVCVVYALTSWKTFLLPFRCDAFMKGITDFMFYLDYCWDLFGSGWKY